MLRVCRRLLSQNSKIGDVMETSKVTSASVSVKQSQNTLSTELSPNLDPLLRYIPTDPSAFLVEDHRLESAERVSQRISSIFPWIIFGLFAVSPYFVMKYNLEKLGATRDSPAEAPLHKVRRNPFMKITFADLTEILERRKPTLVVIYSSGFHSQVLLLLFRELDDLFSKHGIDYSICVFDHSTADETFKSSYPVAPYCQLVLPGNKVVDYSGLWNASNLVRFILPPSLISDEMKADIVEIESNLELFRDCLFGARFVAGNKAWTSDRSISSESLDSALAECRTLRRA